MTASFENHLDGTRDDLPLTADSRARTEPDLFDGRGEMRARARALDWAATPLGSASAWPAALRTAVRLMFDAPVAMSLWVGSSYTLIYNDTYARILGAKHPDALGRSGAAVWDELWPALEPEFAQVRSGRQPVYADEARLTMERLEGGRAEDAWFTYALSALTDESGECLAVFNVAVEVTEKIRARDAVAGERARLFEAFQRVPSFVSVVTGPDHVFEYANEAYYALVGRRDIIGRPVWEAIPDARGQGFEAQLDSVRDTGIPAIGHESPLRLIRAPGAEPEERFVDFAYQALTDADGKPWGVMGYGSDVTDHVRARREVERLLVQSEAERARTTMILESMTDSHFVLDADFRFISVNAASERALRHSREELLGRTVWEMFPNAVGTIFERSYRRVATERVSVHFIGEYEDANLDLVPEVDAYPAAGGGVAVFWRDIGPRMRAEAGLRASEQRLRDVFEQAPVAVAVMTGCDNVFTAVSPLYAKTPGLGRPLLGRSLREAFPELVGTGYIEAVEAVYRTGEAYAATERLVQLTNPANGDLENRFFNLGYQPLRNPDGGVYAVASVAYDVTEQVLVRQEVEKARVDAEILRAEAERANRAKSEFLSTMSHELRTPLNAISGYTELLTLGLRGPITDSQRFDLDRIRRANQHLMGLVTDVLNFARIDAGRVEFHVTDVTLSSVVEDLEPLIGPQLAAKQLRYEHDHCVSTTGQAHSVRADGEKVRQILLNLMTNAVKFTDSGGRVSVKCETDASAGVVRISVCDTGRGIPPDQLERIFEPFVQVDRHRTHESQQGVGLGLSISRDLARAMGGDLVASSTLRQGSTFTLVLPAA